MARPVTLQNIVDRARFHSDLKSSGFVSDAEALLMLNEVWPVLYDELVGAYEDYYSTTATLNLTTGNNVYPLPDDFYKMSGVDFRVNNDAYITLKPYQNVERNTTLTTNVTIPSGVVRLRYVPAPAVFTSLTQSIDGIAGWDRLLSLLLAITFLQAEESDTSDLERRYGESLKRVMDMSAPRDQGMAYRVGDVNRPNIQLIYGALRYHMYGNNIEFINTEYLGSDLFPDFI